jgi:hypothetical protein
MGKNAEAMVHAGLGRGNRGVDRSVGAGGWPRVEKGRDHDGKRAPGGRRPAVPLPLPLRWRRNH